MSNSNPSFDPTQQQTPAVTEKQDYTSNHPHGSVGPAIGAVAVIMVLGAIAVMIGRLCSGRRIMGHRQYDFDGWVETKCSSCIDGKLGPPLPPRVAAPAAAESNGEAAVSAGDGEAVHEGENEMGHQQH